MRTVGLILGRFCPVHRGHQHVIERALGEMDRVVVALFDDPSCPTAPTVRAGWLRRLYPTLDVITVEDLQGDDDAVWKRYHEVFRRGIGERITHVFSSEDYGARIAWRLRAVNVVVDRERTSVPVSATQIRTDPARFKEFLEPFVYDHLVGEP